MITVFAYNADWIFFCFTIHNLKTIVYDPIDGIKKADSRINLYLIITIVFSAIITILTFTGNIYGPSVNK